MLPKGPNQCSSNATSDTLLVSDPAGFAPQALRQRLAASHTQAVDKPSCSLGGRTGNDINPIAEPPPIPLPRGSRLRPHRQMT